MPQPKKFRESLPTALQILRYFWPEIRKHGALITGSLMALFVEIGFRLLEPWPLKFVFDYRTACSCWILEYHWIRQDR